MVKNCYFFITFFVCLKIKTDFSHKILCIWENEIFFVKYRFSFFREFVEGNFAGLRSVPFIKISGFRIYFLLKNQKDFF